MMDRMDGPQGSYPQMTNIYPSRGPLPSSARFVEMLEQMKKDYEAMERELGICKHQRDDLERKVEAQVAEFASLRQTLFELERTHNKMKHQYEDEISRLRRQVMQEMPPSNPELMKRPHIPEMPKRPDSDFFSSPMSSMDKREREESMKFPGIPTFSRPSPAHPQPISTPPASANMFMDRPPSHMARPSPMLTERPEERQAPQVPSPMETDNGFGYNTKDKMVKKDGTDWLVVYNPNLSSNINISLAHNLEHSSVVCCVRFSADGKYLATGCNKYAQIFDVDSGERVAVFPEDADRIDREDSYVRSVCFSPDGKYLVAGAEDKTVKVWDIHSRELINSFEGHELDIYSLDFSPDNRFVVSGSGDGKAKIWNLETGKCQFTLGNDEVGPREGVTSVAISPDGSLVAAGSLDYVVRLWDAHTGKYLQSFKGHEDSVYSVAFSPDGKTLASGSLDKTLKLWDINSRSNQCKLTLGGHRDYVLSVAFSPDGKWLISGSKDRSVHFWDPRSNVLHLMLQGHKNSVISVALSPQSQVFATGSGDHRARIWKYDANGTA